jgi:hypothetical protein
MDIALEPHVSPHMTTNASAPQVVRQNLNHEVIRPLNRQNMI